MQFGLSSFALFWMWVLYRAACRTQLAHLWGVSHLSSECAFWSSSHVSFTVPHISIWEIAITLGCQGFAVPSYKPHSPNKDRLADREV